MPIIKGKWVTNELWKEIKEKPKPKFLRYKKVGICYPNDGKDLIKVIFIRKNCVGAFIPRNMLVDNEDGTSTEIFADGQETIDKLSRD